MSKTANMKIKAALERNLKATETLEITPTAIGRNERRKCEITRLRAALAGRNKKGKDKPKKMKQPVDTPPKKKKHRNSTKGESNG